MRMDETGRKSVLDSSINKKKAYAKRLRSDYQQQQRLLYSKSQQTMKARNANVRSWGRESTRLLLMLPWINSRTPIDVQWFILKNIIEFDFPYLHNAFHAPSNLVRLAMFVSCQCCEAEKHVTHPQLMFENIFSGPVCLKGAKDESST